MDFCFTRNMCFSKKNCKKYNEDIPDSILDELIRLGLQAEPIIQKIDKYSKSIKYYNHELDSECLSLAERVEAWDIVDRLNQKIRLLEREYESLNLEWERLVS